MLRRIIESGNIPNMVFYGPSGTGKTTVANIIAQRTHRTLHRLNATTAGISDIREVISDVDTLMAPNGVLLYLDEIQYFNKKQQQSLLEFMENGKITLIASTTENPYFYVFNAVLSRATVFEFKPVTPEEVAGAVRRAVNILAERRGIPVQVEDGVVETLSSACGGDVRKSINAVELLFSAGHEAGRKTRPDSAGCAAGRPAQRHALRPGRGRTLRHSVCAPEIHPGFRSGCGASLSGPPADGGRSDLCLPPHHGHCVGRCGAGLSTGRHLL